VKRVYLVRHGKAEDYGPSGSDADRRLTPEGRAELAAITKNLKRIDEKIEVALTSPLRRAVETAEVMAEKLGIEVEVTTELEPPVSPPRLLARVRKRAEQRLLLVGHQPGLGHAAARWIEARADAIPLKKAGIARLDVPDEGEGGAVELVWLATPELLIR
jgi:phosphohistidine phosphatase